MVNGTTVLVCACVRVCAATGHNWGAEHDPDTSDCGPSSRNNGKYVMWAYAVPGYEENNVVSVFITSFTQ